MSHVCNELAIELEKARDSYDTIRKLLAASENDVSVLKMKLIALEAERDHLKELCKKSGIRC